MRGRVSNGHLTSIKLKFELTGVDVSDVVPPVIILDLNRVN